MAYVKWAFIIVFWALVASVLHYTLPQQDVARITDTYERRVDPGTNSLFWAQADTGSDGTLLNRDVFFIQARLFENGGEGQPMVYRNEATGWGWPPYFKFTTSNLQAEASDLRSTAENPRWVVIRHYGWWGADFVEVFPNAVSIRPIDDPDARIIPWMNIAILLGLFAVYWAIRVRWLRFWENRVDPALDSVGDSLDSGSSRLRRLFGR
jgi:hypothetical protein